MEPRRITCSLHAAERYRQRFGRHLSVGEVRARIEFALRTGVEVYREQQMDGLAQWMRCSVKRSLRRRDSIEVVVKNGVVITVLPPR